VSTLVPKVLIVDDQLDTVAFVNILVKQAECQPIHADSGKKALDMAKSEHPILILLDHYMPEMTGRECCRLIKLNEKLRDIPIIMVTSAVDLQEVKECFEAGCDDYVTKPIPQAHLKDKISTILKAHKAQQGSDQPTKSFNRTVLFAGIDDEANLLLNEALLKFGYEVVRAFNDRQALDLAKEHQGRLDCLICDLTLREWKLKLLEELKKSNLLEQIPIIMIGEERQSKEDAKAMYDLAVMLYLEKSLSCDESLFRINHIFFSHQTNDIRKTARIPAIFLIKYQIKRRTYQGYTYNLSEDGIFIRTVNPPEPGTEITVTFSLPDDEERITGEGQVVWCQNYTSYHLRFSYPGMGVHFGELSVIDEEKLIRYIQSNLIPESY